MASPQQLSLKRLAIESAAIVASILLAFAIDAWWDERQERIAEAEIVLGLKLEFEENRRLMQEGFEYHAQLMLAVQNLIVATRNLSWTSTSMTIDDAIEYLRAPPTLDIGGGVLDAVISADRLQIISNKNLRRQLAGWESVLDEVRDDQSRDSDFAFNRVVPFLIQHGISTGHGANSQYGDWPVPTESIAADAEILTQLLADQEFRALLDIRLADLYHTQ